eukprot:7036019-Prymnesium_polylepis.1
MGCTAPPTDRPRRGTIAGWEVASSSSTTPSGRRRSLGRTARADSRGEVRAVVQLGREAREAEVGEHRTGPCVLDVHKHVRRLEIAVEYGRRVVMQLAAASARFYCA